MSIDIENVSRRGLLIGSRQMLDAEHTLDSDWDFIIFKKDADKILSKVNWSSCSEIEQEDDYGCEVWGEYLEDIVKFQDKDGNVINLFIYEDSADEIFSKFIKLNNMVLDSGRDLTVKTTRIELYLEFLRELEITTEL